MTGALVELISNPDLRKTMGEAAKKKYTEALTAEKNG